MLTRRSLFSQMTLLGAGALGFLALRKHVLWPTPDVVFPQGRASTGWLPLPFHRPLIELPAAIEGFPVRVLVDSGAQYSVVDRALAERLKLPTATGLPILAYGVSGAPTLGHTVRASMQVAGLALSGLRAAVLDLGHVAELTGAGFEAILGRDLLSQVVTDVDYPRRRVAFHRPDAYRPPAGSVLAPVRSDGGALMASVSIEGAPPIEVLVDTGATGDLALTERAAEAAGLLSGRLVGDAPSVSLGGMGRDRLVHVSEVGFAGLELRNVPVHVFTPGAGAPAPNGLLGVGILQAFRVGLDHAGGRMFLAGDDLQRLRARDAKRV